eukprot:7149465-Prymnesium_polylepis.2
MLVHGVCFSTRCCTAAAAGRACARGGMVLVAVPAVRGQSWTLAARALLHRRLRRAALAHWPCLHTMRARLGVPRMWGCYERIRPIR